MKSILMFAAGALAGAVSLFYVLQNDFATPGITLINRSEPSAPMAYAPTPEVPSVQLPVIPPVAEATTQLESSPPQVTSIEAALNEEPLAPPSAPPVENLSAPEPSAIEPSPALPVREDMQVQTVPAEPLQVHPGALLIPVTGIVTAQLSDTFYDKRGTDRIHEALDIMAPLKTPVVAVDDGIVMKLFDSVPGGLTVYQYDASDTFTYYYAHLDSYAEGLVEGQKLKRGDLIGYVGVTGNSNPAAPHLHFAIFLLGPEKNWWQGTTINPYPLFQR